MLRRYLTHVQSNGILLRTAISSLLELISKAELSRVSAIYFRGECSALLYALLPSIRIVSSLYGVLIG